MWCVVITIFIDFKVLSVWIRMKTMNEYLRSQIGVGNNNNNSKNKRLERLQKFDPKEANIGS